MLIILKLLYEEIKNLDHRFYRDPRTSHLPLLGAPWPMLGIVALYLLFVTKWGPKWMATRKPFNVKLYMQAYNVLQVLLNSYIFIASFKSTVLEPQFSLTCQPYNTQDHRPFTIAMLPPAYAYYISKYLDILDTIFFVVRKKNNQITFLHVYHHAIMIYGVWVYNTLLFGSHFSMVGVTNAFIHVCMYSYYFMSATDLKLDLCWWKRFLTKLQIIQFCYNTIHFAQVIFNNSCGLDMFWVWVVFLQNAFILVLFCEFYYRAYVVKDRKAKRELTAQLKSNKPSVKSQLISGEGICSTFA